MNWYYAAGGQQQGPVDEAQLDALIQSGQINQETLVWREGMPNWQPLRQARAGSAPAGTPPPAAASAAPSTGIGDVVCAECRGIFTKDNAIQYGTAWVCATCKPVFLQKLREGAGTPGALGLGDVRYAGFWIRVAAKFIDGLVIGIVVGIPILALMFGMGLMTQQAGQQPNVAMVGMQFLLQIVWMGAGIAYNTFMHGKYGATLGKMAVGVRVVMADGAPITYMRAFGRAWADILSSLVCNIGYIIAGFDKEKRALHDHICQTRVIYK